MKTKKLFHVASVLAMGLALASCGSDNKSNGNQVSNGFGNFNVGSNGQTVSSNTCQGGQATSYSFSLSGPNTNSFYLLQMQQGQQVSGGTTNVYYGRDVGTGDQIAVQKISNGQYAQYNFHMSICPINIQYTVKQLLMHVHGVLGS